MKTNNKKYKEHFEALADRRAEAKAFANRIDEKILTQDTF
jgi:hypothetical protein